MSDAIERLEQDIDSLTLAIDLVQQTALELSFLDTTAHSLLLGAQTAVEQVRKALWQIWRWSWNWNANIPQAAKFRRRVRRAQHDR
jgi:hypothetical protein